MSGCRLTGVRVLLTRDGGLARELRALGAEVRVAEVTRFLPVEAPVDPSGFDWIVFTSARAVAYSRFPLSSGARVACVGPSTTRAVVEKGGQVDRTSSAHDAASLARELVRKERMEGARVLFPCSDRALDTIPAILGAAGAHVTRLVVYRTEAADVLLGDVTREIDVAVFLAPSAVVAFFDLGGRLGAARALAIGTTTAGALVDRGVTPDVAPTSDREGLVRALLLEYGK